MLATQKGRSKPVRISSKRSEKLKSGSLMTRFTGGASQTVLYSNPSAYFFGRQSGDANQFCAAGLAGGNGNGRARYLQKSCEEFDAGVVGFAIDRRGGERNFDHTAECAGNRVFFGAGMDFDGERDATG